MSLHGGNIYDFAGGDEIVDYSSNINPYGPPAYAISAAHDALALVGRYPDVGQHEIGAAFSAWLSIPRERLVFGNGASELIAATCAALAPNRVLIVVPTFAEYAMCAGRLGIPVSELPADARESFAPPVGRICEVCAPGDLLIVCQPNNPTARTWTEGELTRLSRMCASRGAWMLVDECFINLTYPRAFSSLGMSGEGHLLVLRALTKDFSAPGLRVGFLAAPPQVAARVRAYLQPWPLNCVGERFAIACANCPEPFLSDSAMRIAGEREVLQRGFSRLGFFPFPSDVNFILMRSDDIPVETVYSELLKESFLIRKCNNFSGLTMDYFRIAVKDGVNNEHLLSSLARIVHR